MCHQQRLWIWAVVGALVCRQQRLGIWAVLEVPVAWEALAVLEALVVLVEEVEVIARLVEALVQ